MTPEELLRSALTETGVSLKISADELVRYVAEQGATLALAIGEPGFDKALIAARNAIALKAGLNATLEAEAADARIVGVLQGVLLGLAS